MGFNTKSEKINLAFVKNRNGWLISVIKNNWSYPSFIKTKMTEIEKGVQLALNALMKFKDAEIAELKRKHKLEMEIVQEENKDLRTVIKSLKAKSAKTEKRRKIEINTLKRISTLKFKKAKKILMDGFSQMQENKESEIKEIKRKHYEATEKLNDRLDSVKMSMSNREQALRTVINQLQFAEKKNEQLMVDWKRSIITLFKAISKRSGCRTAWSTVLDCPNFPKLSDESVNVQGDILNIYDIQFKKCIECKKPYGGRCRRKPRNLILPLSDMEPCEIEWNPLTFSNKT